MGLASVGPLDSKNAGIADPDLVRHAASAPVRGVDGLFEGGQPHHFGDCVGGYRWQTSRAWSLLLQAGKAFCEKAPTPAGGLLYGNGERFGDLQVLLSVCCE